MELLPVRLVHKTTLGFWTGISPLSRITITITNG
jgi:hypothetical protein